MNMKNGLMSRRGKEVYQQPIANRNEDSDDTTPRTSEKRLEQKRRYNKRSYQEMSQENRQALLLKNRARKQLKSGESSSGDLIPNAVARSNVQQGMHIDAAPVLAPHDANENCSYGVQTRRKRVYNKANAQPSVNTDKQFLNVGIYLPDPVFSHGQLYFALSRGTSRRTTKVMIKPTERSKRRGVYTQNIVYREVLSDD